MRTSHKREIKAPLGNFDCLIADAELAAQDSKRIESEVDDRIERHKTQRALGREAVRRIVETVLAEKVRLLKNRKIHIAFMKENLWGQIRERPQNSQQTGSEVRFLDEEN